MQQQIVSEDRIRREVGKAIQNALGIDGSLINPDSVLVLDLNAESLDFLDISYSIEQAFGIRLSRQFILELAEEKFGEGTVIDRNNLLTAKGVELLRLRFGSMAQKIKPGDHLQSTQSLFTVRVIENRVKEILDTIPEKCEHCGHAGWASSDGARIECGGCGEAAEFTSGDDLQLRWLDRISREKPVFNGQGA